jgi:hypothetical protein
MPRIGTVLNAASKDTNSRRVEFRLRTRVDSLRLRKAA